jgi:hypothetical protein
MDLPIEIRNSFLEQWDQYVEPTLGARAHAQFVAATRRGSHLLVNAVLRPSLFRPDVDDDSYYPVAATPYEPGRNHLLAERLATDPVWVASFNADPFVALTHFANPLRIGQQVWDEWREEHVWTAPKDRVVLGYHQILTYEFDIADREFLNLQLSWLRTSKNRLDCKAGELFRHCSQYTDFAGITVNYSGNKSLHIHIVFDTLHARSLRLHERGSLRAGIAAHWNDLHQELLRVLDVPAGVTADRSLRFPESYRRLPNGMRCIESDKHLLGIPKDTAVQQVTLWEEWRDRAAAGATASFWRPGLFFPTPASPSTRSSTVSPADQPAQRPIGRLSPEEFAYCEAQLRQLYPDWPRFDHLAHEGGRYVARFLNSDADTNPASIMREDHRAVLLQGRDAAGLRPRRLPYPLGTMMRLWVAKHRSLGAGPSDIDYGDHILPPAPKLHSEDPLAADFRVASDKETASREVAKLLRRTLTRHERSWICAPEGIRKTSSLIAHQHRMHAWLEARGEPTLTLHAFADYAAAITKCDDFNAVQGSRGFLGVVVPSFTRAYEEACSTVGVEPLSVRRAAEAGYPSRWAAIEDLQPAVLDELRVRHAAMWASLQGKKPVLFTVHQVAHHWSENSPSRLMLAPDFWRGRLGDPVHDRLCRQQTMLGLLVHDEVKAEHLVAMYPAEVVDWVAALAVSAPGCWRGRRGGAAALLRSFDTFVAAQGFPNIAGRPREIRFEEAREIAAIAGSSWAEVVTAWSGEYGVPDDEEAEDDLVRRDIYQMRIGRRWRVAPRGWWRGVATRVVVLTTEAVPTAVARHLSPDWSVLELETPLLPRDEVEVHALRGVTSAGLPGLVKEWRQRLGGDIYVVSNKVACLPETRSHAAARGANDLIGRDLLQTMTFLSPEEVERLEALNAWTARGDLIRLRHVDEFNQSAGRNLGFRRQGTCRHHLLVNRRLFGHLLGPPLARSRYDLRVHLDKHQRCRIKAAPLDQGKPGS